MNRLNGGWRWLHRLRAAVFGVVIVAFFLPFMTLACTVQPLQTQISGIELMTGTPPNGNQSGTGIPAIQPQPAAGVAFMAAWVGLTSSFLSSRWGLWVPVGSGALGGTLLLILKSRFDERVATEGAGVLRLVYHPGFWLAVGGFLVGYLVNCLLLNRTRS
ncbi:hypothetical protein GlitD10_0159 [Gloeomargarita lithophora Alchichica-D10]|uniref:Uncharacterized protein n=1 Tax=Gloeomargarita lithophora Alchichica-D10 TaxID=1188229 RepID=A0A1J0A950_9CYAN|nr:hypothetical protein [Gloeomargarita lithophora]APB32460.1 hypothetical protein GlitD10_0159 [Gloeomargarita lithophora Alchichica-D10]